MYVYLEKQFITLKKLLKPSVMNFTPFLFIMVLRILILIHLYIYSLLMDMLSIT
jgi:hypothetical protein